MNPKNPQAASEGLRKGDRVLWQSSNGTEFPGTIVRVRSIYDCKLDDGCDANGFAGARFKLLATTPAVAPGGDAIRAAMQIAGTFGACPVPAAGNAGPTFACREADDDHLGCAKWCGNHVYCVVSGNIEPKPERAALDPADPPMTEGDKITAQNEAFDIAESMAANPPAADDVRVVVADLRRLGKEDGWLCATAGADMIEALLAAKEASRG